jgi:iron complex outermembrane receptor protein
VDLSHPRLPLAPSGNGVPGPLLLYVGRVSKEKGLEDFLKFTPKETEAQRKAQEQINTVNTEDMLKFAPSLVVRKRHYGDTQDPIATRTSATASSCR